MYGESKITNEKFPDDHPFRRTHILIKYNE